ncbi:alpha/beta hydrolase [uncultured Cellulomonas sp.]|uniref:alpha/beta hydrolase n=1 Tax=uncultured Cellulomonas sp. TaxID=189682 RepID=UPI0028E5B9FF|nr:alpha/beta hydrolase [uncultured Cellulomonas sp.]
MSQHPLAIVLVHGAFADAGSWAPTTELLIEAGTKVTAIANPLRGLHGDATYVASVINQIPGPVLAVGHSYGGAVITNACASTPNVVGLVYIAAFAPDEGERLVDRIRGSVDSVLTTALVQTQYPVGPGDATADEVVIDPARFHAVFAADLPPFQSDVFGQSQRPVAVGSFTEETGTPAWQSLPVWAAVATADTTAGSDLVLSMAERAGATITEIDGSHAIAISQPEAVAEVILSAYRALS